MSDDIESFYHILALFALRFHKHSLTGQPDEIKDILEGQYDKAVVRNGFWLGSHKKRNQIKLGELPAPLATRDRFSRLLQYLVSMCKKHYELQDHEELQRRFGVPNDTDVAPKGVPTAETTQTPKPFMKPPTYRARPPRRAPASSSASQMAQRGVEVPTTASSSSPSTAATAAGPSALPSIPLANASQADATDPFTFTSHSAPIPGPSPLDSHDAFCDIFYSALEADDESDEEDEEEAAEDGEKKKKKKNEFKWTEPPEGLTWTADDKTHDQFREIDWSPRPAHSLVPTSTKRTHDSAFSDTKRSRVSGKPDAGGSEQEEGADGEPKVKKLRRSVRLNPE